LTGEAATEASPRRDATKSDDHILLASGKEPLLLGEED